MKIPVKYFITIIIVVVAVSVILLFKVPKNDSSYDRNFADAEEKYHVSNTVEIHIKEVEEIQKLQVLQVSGVDYNITDNSKNHMNIDAWLEVHGRGVFTVDLSAGEYVTDNVRKSVIVRVPRPVLENFSLDEHTRVFLYKNNGWKNYSYKEGEALFDSMVQESCIRIRDELSSETRYTEQALSSAEKLITNTVKACNSDIPDLKVYVEFI